MYIYIYIYTHTNCVYPLLPHSPPAPRGLNEDAALGRRSRCLQPQNNNNSNNDNNNNNNKHDNNNNNVIVGIIITTKVGISYNICS